MVPHKPRTCFSVIHQSLRLYNQIMDPLAYLTDQTQKKPKFLCKKINFSQPQHFKKKT